MGTPIEQPAHLSWLSSGPRWRLRTRYNRRLGLSGKCAVDNATVGLLESPMSDAPRGFLRTIDGVLRGHFTRKEELAEGRVSAPTGSIVTAAVILGATYGLFMGLFALLHPGRSGLAQCFASIVKVPLLFLLTLVVTLPSLYVVSALFDSRLRLIETLRLLLLAILVNLALLASFGPVTAFFTLSTTSYPFMVLLNVAFFTISGFVGLAFLRRALDGVFTAATPAPAAPPPLPPPEASPETPVGEHMADFESRRRRPPPAQSSGRVFRVWILIYAVVGAQMGWILRPFIGNPHMPFQFFRARGSNFFQAVLDAIKQLMHG